jgi:hypothetical protein
LPLVIRLGASWVIFTIWSRPGIPVPSRMLDSMARPPNPCEPSGCANRFRATPGSELCGLRRGGASQS